MQLIIVVKNIRMWDWSWSLRRVIKYFKSTKIKSYYGIIK